jgi:glycosyltransferase involved in cell wall biosynthesis
MRIAFQTSANFLDAALEIIQSLKREHTLFVFIEVTEISKKSTILDIESLEGLNTLEPPERVLNDVQLQQFRSYFEGVAQVRFVIHRNKRSLTPKGFGNGFKLGLHLSKLKLDVWHFDNLSMRVLGLFPFVMRQPILITLHDPKPHTGEEDWKYDLNNWIFFRFARAFVFYSQFAMRQFKAAYPKIKHPIRSITLLPYTFVQNYKKGKPISENPPILFFGRLSPYKGVDLLLESIPAILNRYPNQRFIIAGKSIHGFELNQDILKKYADNIHVIPEYIHTATLVELIESSAFVVCPYLDATQSGVLSTAFAVGKSILATNVGSFPEYIEAGKNGWLVEPNAQSLADGILHMLDQNRFQQYESNVESNASHSQQSKLCMVLSEAYENCLK